MAVAQIQATAIEAAPFVAIFDGWLPFTKPDKLSLRCAYRLSSNTYPDSTSVEYAYELSSKVQ
jgi:hypothetical protein